MVASMIGALGESIVEAEFLRRGVPVYKPQVDTGADLVVDIGGALQRVQVKSSSCAKREVKFCLGRRDSRRGKARHGWKSYEEGSVDWFALVCLGHDYVALVPAGRLNCKLTFDSALSSRLAEMEIGAVIERLTEEKE